MDCLTDQRTDQRTNRWMDTPSYRDARTYLKSIESIFLFFKFWCEVHQKLKSGKFSWPTMRPQACMIIICAAFLSVAWFNNHFSAFLIHEGMPYFLLFWLKRDGPMDRWMDRLSYIRDIRMHLKSIPWVQQCILVWRSNWRMNQSSGSGLKHFYCDFWRGFTIIYGENYAFLSLFTQALWTNGLTDTTCYRAVRTQFLAFLTLWRSFWPTFFEKKENTVIS